MRVKKVFKILTIDGGGIKGLYSSKIIEHFEDEFNCHMSDYFDLICGTSTGGIIALALSLRIKAKEISKLYEEKGSLIFPAQVKLIGIAKQLFINGKYSDKNLRVALKETFGDKKIKDSNNLLCIPCYSLTDARNWVFKYDHKENNSCRDNESYYVDVALATSSAPTFFPICEIPYYDHKQFVDGGVWANNPSLVGLIEALRFFVGPGKEFNELKILSISCLSHTLGKRPGIKRNRSFLHWRNDIFNIMMNSQAKFNEYFMSQMNNTNSVPISYVRILPEILSPEQQKLISMDNSSKNAINLLNGLGNNVGFIWRKREEVADFFKEQKLYQIK